MARKPRIKIPGHAAVYHVVNRVNQKRHNLDRYMKQYFLELLAKLRNLYYVKYAGFTILNNHYHLLLNFLDPEDVDPKEAIEVWNTYHEETPYTRNPALKKDRDYVVRELTDVSSFMKRFNFHLTQRYNWRTGKVGTLWERRFRSSIMGKGCAQVMCGAYIELNAFRASLVTKPEDYEFSSLHQLKNGNPGNLVDTDLLEEGLFIETDELQELYFTYLSYIYKAGTKSHKDEPDGIVIGKKMKQQLAKYGLEIKEGSLSERIRDLIDGKVTGGEQLSQIIYEEYINPGLRGTALEYHRERWIRGCHLTGGDLWSVCSAMMRGSP